MKLVEAVRLGPLCQILGFNQEDRIQMDFDQEGIHIWHIPSGMMYSSSDAKIITRTFVPLPDYVAEVVGDSTESLVQKVQETQGWGDVRATILTELIIRGVNTLHL